MKLIDDALINRITEEAKASPRLRMNYNFHQSLEDKCHCFLNALEPGTIVPIHHHKTKDETFILLKGRVRVLTYNDEGMYWRASSYAKRRADMVWISPRTHGTRWNALSPVAVSSK